MTPPITPSLDDLRQAAVTAQAPPAEPVVVAPVEPPPPADPWQVKTVDGGNYEVQIEGQVFKGTHQQVLNELAKAQYHATKTIKETRSEYETFKQQHQPPPAPPVVPTTNAESPEVLAARDYLVDEHAKGLGFANGAEYKAFLNQGRQVVENTTQNSLVSGFFNLVPEFPDNNETVEKLFKVQEENGLPLTPQGLRAAHLIAVAEKQYTPLTADQIKVQQAKALGIDMGAFTPPTPAPMVPSSSSVTTSAPFNPYDPKVPLDRVREWAAQAQK